MNTTLFLTDIPLPLSYQGLVFVCFGWGGFFSAFEGWGMKTETGGRETHILLISALTKMQSGKTLTSNSYELVKTDSHSDQIPSSSPTLTARSQLCLSLCVIVHQV